LSLLLIVALLLGSVAAIPAQAAVPDQPAADTALDWLRAQQLPDGAFAGFSGSADPGSSADVALAFAAADINPARVESPEGNSVIDYLIGNAGSVSANPGVAAKVSLVLIAARANPRDAGGHDLIAAIEAGYDPATGIYGQGLFGHTLAVLALDASGTPVEPGAIDALLNTQIEDGSWGFGGSTELGTGDSNTTAMAIQALAAVGAGGDAVARGLDYLRSVQNASDASIAYDTQSVGDPGGDANSTALAIQAFTAAGQDPAALAHGDLLPALARFQNDSGAFRFQDAFPNDSLLATAQAVPALLLKAYPLSPVSENSPLRDAVEPAARLADCDYHEPTQHNLCGAFRDFWHAHGGLANFGFALSEELDFYGLQVQYFERARFEYHPELAGTPYDVLLTRLAAADVARSYQALTPPTSAQAGCTYFDVTGHNLCGDFAALWNAAGGLAVFGYPLTEPFDDEGHQVQYFERARFETGTWPERFNTLLGLVGTEAVERELAR
jgi:hypothetical protein